MNGWQRLWAVISVILAVVVIYGGSNAMPREQRIQKDHERIVVKTVADASERIEAYKRLPRSPEVDEWISNLGASTQDRLTTLSLQRDTKLKELPMEQMRFGGEMFVIWLALSLGAYGVGLVFMWVIRGFRPRVV